MTKPIISLIPWDPLSPDHVERMVAQRIACGWHAPKVATEWRDGHIQATKCVYWVVLQQDEPQREKYHKMHIEAYPTEKSELVDSNSTLLGKPRASTGASFLPVGHIALETQAPAKLDFPIPQSDAYWIKGLYVSYALQGCGIGGAAIDIAERIATETPLNARHLLLDTVHHVDQSDEAFATAIYGGTFKIPTQSLYERRGYRLIGTVENLYQDPDPSGKIWPCRTVFLQKDIA